MAFPQAVRDPGWGKLTRLAARLPSLVAGLAARPVWVLLFVSGRFHFARRIATAIAGWMGPRAAERAAGRDEPLTDQDFLSVVAALRRDGICAGLRLPPETVAAIRAFAESNICYGGPNWDLPVEPWNHEEAERRHGRKVLVANFPDSDQHCPAIAALIRNPWLHDVAAAYLGSRAQIIDLRLWWSFPAPGARRIDLSRVAQDTFHFDLADWGQAKFFFYLTDVEPETGAHVYVRGSHVNRPLSDQLTLFSARSDADIIRRYGTDAIQMLTGPAGTGFVEDPFGYHTGLAVRRGRRLILEVSFGITNVTRRRRYGEIAN